MTKIEWTDATWNPVTGCDKVSPGCDNCYAETMALRLKSMRKPGYEHGFALRLRHDRLDEKSPQHPARLRRPRNIFVNSMSDLFHPDVPYDFIDEVVNVMRLTPQHRYQVLTKRPKTALHWWKQRVAPHFLPDNFWIGTSIEAKAWIDRMSPLREIPAKVRFLSLEPLLEDLGELSLTGIAWVIAGGESGRGARPVHADWIRSIRDQCAEQSVPFFFKQWGGFNKSKTGRELDGRTHSEFPKSWL